MKKKTSKTSKKKLPLKKSIFYKLLNSTMVLYLVFLVTCINIFNFIITKKDESLFLFILISVIIYEFNGNMILILGIPLVIVNLLLYLKNIFNSTKENMSINDSPFNKIIENIERNGIPINIRDYTKEGESIELAIQKIRSTDNKDDLQIYYEVLASIIVGKIMQNDLMQNDPSIDKSKLEKIVYDIIEKVFDNDNSITPSLPVDILPTRPPTESPGRPPSIIPTDPPLPGRPGKPTQGEDVGVDLVGGSVEQDNNVKCSDIGYDTSHFTWIHTNRKGEPKHGKDCAWVNNKWSNRKKKKGNLYTNGGELICTNIKANKHCVRG